MRDKSLTTWPIWLAGAVIVLLAVSLGAYFASRPDESFELVMTAGSTSNSRYKLALHFVEQAQKDDVALKVVGCDGSVAAIELVNRGEVDVALVQGGLRLADQPNVQQLSALYVEPLQLLVKGALHAKVSEDLVAVRGHTVDLSKPGSGTYRLSREVLRFAGLRAGEPDGGVWDFTPVQSDHGKLLADLAATEEAPADREALLETLPDAVFIVGSVPSDLAKRLVASGGYGLAPLRFGQAFALVSVDEEERDSDGIAQRFIQSTDVPAYAYSVTPPVPSEPCPTLGTRLLLIAHKDVPPEAVTRLLKIVHEGPLQKLYAITPLAELLPEYDLHAGAVRYRDRDKPIIRAEIIAFLQNVASVLGPAFGGLLALYGLFRWRQTLKFRRYFHEICRIREIAAGRVHEPGWHGSPSARRQSLEARLDDLQQQAVNDFSRQYFHGEGVMEILLALLADVRSTLHREPDENGTVGARTEAADNRNSEREKEERTLIPANRR
jgi:TRAP-type uncharacterized transport system substrate-binding protein